MIVRTWTGRVPIRHAAAFARHLQATGAAECATVPGCLGSRTVRTEIDGWVEFRFISRWQSWEAIGLFAGPDIGKAVLYPGDEAYELRASATVEHEEIEA
ncbi:hypothetical protein AB0K16_21005 [Nonomuraea jabiensis]|uniref:hypothetical protein n=1 Tax=Nonomuraea jabiensis TaxID=882448 RepID=UPI003429597D